MRKALLLLVLAPAALVYACGGDSTTTDGGTDATSGDATNDTSKPDTSTDTGTNDTGVKDSGGGDVSIVVTCLKPADCFDGGGDAAFPPDSGEVCCGTVQTSGTIPNCSFDQASTACVAPGSCATSIGTSSCGTDKVRLCESDTECTEKTTNPLSSYTKCCSTSVGDAGRVHFCANTTIANLSNGAITCP